MFPLRVCWGKLTGSQDRIHIDVLKFPADVTPFIQEQDHVDSSTSNTTILMKYIKTPLFNINQVELTHNETQSMLISNGLDHKFVASAHTTIPPFIQTQDRSSKHKTTVPPPQLWGAYNIFSHGNTWKLGYKVPISSSSTYTAPINTIWTHQYYLDICVHRGVSWYKTPPTNTIGTAAHSFLMFLRSFITCSSKRIQICLLHVWHM